MFRVIHRRRGLDSARSIYDAQNKLANLQKDKQVIFNNFQEQMGSAKQPSRATPQVSLKTFQGPPGGLSLAWSSDGKLLAAGGKDTSIRVWSVETANSLHVLRRSPQGKYAWQAGIVALAFSRDGNVLASGGEDGIISLWDLRTARLSRSLLGHSDPVHGLAFSPRTGAGWQAVAVEDLISRCVCGRPRAAMP